LLANNFFDVLFNFGPRQHNFPSAFSAADFEIHSHPQHAEFIILAGMRLFYLDDIAYLYIHFPAPFHPKANLCNSPAAFRPLRKTIAAIQKSFYLLFCYYNTSAGFVQIFRPAPAYIRTVPDCEEEER
jgi:hypothetical protein